jgi:uncharacterized membrane protein
MEPSINVILLWVLFAGTHVGLTTARPRTFVVSRLGEWGYTGVFSAVALVTYALLVRYFAMHRFDGEAGPALGTAPLVGWALFSLSTFGAALMSMSIFNYPASAHAIGSGQREYVPRPIERISRHGFFAGLGILALAHALLASRLVGSVFFGCLAVFTYLGSVHQDTRLLAARGDVHRRYLASTSTLPFGAVIARRQNLDLRGIPIAAWLAAVLIPVLLRAYHDAIFAADGAYVIGVTGIGAGLAALQSWRMQKRVPGRVRSAAA